MCVYPLILLLLLIYYSLVISSLVSSWLVINGLTELGRYSSFACVAHAHDVYVNYATIHELWC